MPDWIKKYLLITTPRLLAWTAFAVAGLWICLHKPWPAETCCSLVDDRYQELQYDNVARAAAKDLALPVANESPP